MATRTGLKPVERQRKTKGDRRSRRTRTKHEKPPWDDTIHDLDEYKASSNTLARRKHAYQSRHAQNAKRLVKDAQKLREQDMDRAPPAHPGLRAGTGRKPRGPRHVAELQHAGDDNVIMSSDQPARSSPQKMHSTPQAYMTRQSQPLITRAPAGLNNDQSFDASQFAADFYDDDDEGEDEEARGDADDMSSMSHSSESHNNLGGALHYLPATAGGRGMALSDSSDAAHHAHGIQHVPFGVGGTRGVDTGFGRRGGDVCGDDDGINNAFEDADGIPLVVGGRDEDDDDDDDDDDDSLVVGNETGQLLRVRRPRPHRRRRRQHRHAHQRARIDQQQQQQQQQPRQPVAAVQDADNFQALAPEHSPSSTEQQQRLLFRQQQHGMRSARGANGGHPRADRAEDAVHDASDKAGGSSGRKKRGERHAREEEQQEPHPMDADSGRMVALSDVQQDYVSYVDLDRFKRLVSEHQTHARDLQQQLPTDHSSKDPSSRRVRHMQRASFERVQQWAIQQTKATMEGLRQLQVSELDPESPRRRSRHRRRRGGADADREPALETIAQTPPQQPMWSDDANAAATSSAREGDGVGPMADEEDDVCAAVRAEETAQTTTSVRKEEKHQNRHDGDHANDDGVDGGTGAMGGRFKPAGERTRAHDGDTGHHGRQHTDRRAAAQQRGETGQQRLAPADYPRETHRRQQRRDKQTGPSVGVMAAGARTSRDPQARDRTTQQEEQQPQIQPSAAARSARAAPAQHEQQQQQQQQQQGLGARAGGDGVEEQGRATARTTTATPSSGKHKLTSEDETYYSQHASSNTPPKAVTRHHGGAVTTANAGTATTQEAAVQQDPHQQQRQRRRRQQELPGQPQHMQEMQGERVGLASFAELGNALSRSVAAYERASGRPAVSSPQFDRGSGGGGSNSRRRRKETGDSQAAGAGEAGQGDTDAQADDHGGFADFAEKMVLLITRLTGYLADSDRARTQLEHKVARLENLLQEQRDLLADLSASQRRQAEQHAQQLQAIVASNTQESKAKSSGNGGLSTEGESTAAVQQLNDKFDKMNEQVRAIALRLDEQSRNPKRLLDKREAAVQPVTTQKGASLQHMARAHEQPHVSPQPSDAVGGRAFPSAKGPQPYPGYHHCDAKACDSDDDEDDDDIGHGIGDDNKGVGGDRGQRGVGAHREVASKLPMPAGAATVAAMDDGPSSQQHMQHHRDGSSSAAALHAYMETQMEGRWREQQQQRRAAGAIARTQKDVAEKEEEEGEDDDDDNEGIGERQTLRRVVRGDAVGDAAAGATGTQHTAAAPAAGDSHRGFSPATQGARGGTQHRAGEKHHRQQADAASSSTTATLVARGEEEPLDRSAGRVFQSARWGVGPHESTGTYPRHRSQEWSGEGAGNSCGLGRERAQGAQPPSSSAHPHHNSSNSQPRLGMETPGVSVIKQAPDQSGQGSPLESAIRSAIRSVGLPSELHTREWVARSHDVHHGKSSTGTFDLFDATMTRLEDVKPPFSAATSPSRPGVGGGTGTGGFNPAATLSSSLHNQFDTDVASTVNGGGTEDADARRSAEDDLVAHVLNRLRQSATALRE